jgi:hypothetical protein
MQAGGSLPCSQELRNGPYPEPDRSSPSISLRSILTLSTYLHLGLPNGLFPSGFSTKILYAFLFAHTRASCPAHLIFLDWIILILRASTYTPIVSKELERLIWGCLKIISSRPSIWNRTVNGFTKLTSHLPSLSVCILLWAHVARTTRRQFFSFFWFQFTELCSPTHYIDVSA